jgi:hypothetical protein
MMDSVNSGDTVWIMTSTALVLLKVPALAFFYGGMVRRENVLSTSYLLPQHGPDGCLASSMDPAWIRPGVQR